MANKRLPPEVLHQAQWQRLDNFNKVIADIDRALLEATRSTQNGRPSVTLEANKKYSLCQVSVSEKRSNPSVYYSCCLLITLVATPFLLHPPSFDWLLRHF